MYCAIGAFYFYYNKTVYQLIIFPYFFNGLFIRLVYAPKQRVKPKHVRLYLRTAQKKGTGQSRCLFPIAFKLT